MLRHLARFVVALVIPLSGALAAENSPHANQPTAAELVQGVIDAENKINDAQSLYLRFEGKWTNIAEEIAVRRARLEKQFPGEEIDDRQHSELWPEMTEELEIAFDRHRVRLLSEWHKSRRDLRIFDGTRAVAHDEYFTHKQEGFALRAEPQEFFGHFGTDLSWLRVGAPSFWFKKQDHPPEAAAEMNGLPKDYELAGEETLDGRDCYLLRNTFARRELHVGKEDRRLYRLTLFILDVGSNSKPAVAKAAGRSFVNDKQEEAWFKALSEPERAAYVKRLMHELFPISRPWVVHNLSDYREVKPGFWIPFSQGYAFLDNRKPPQFTSSRELHVVEAKIDEPLADELFLTDIKLKDGVQIADYTHDPPLFYKHKADRTPEEFQAIIDEHKRDNEAWQKQQAARDALIGQPAPELPQSEWLNSDKLDWAALKGKVVLLDFWSTSCGPCRNDLPHVEQLHKQRDNSGIVAIGIHTQGETKEDVAAFAKEMELTYPIAIDLPVKRGHGFGEFFEQVQVNAIPYSLLIGRDGKVAAHGRLGELLPKARELAAAGSDEANQ